MNEKNVITKEYDYSNKVPMIEYITYLVNYCNDIFEKFKKLVDDDEEKNKMLKLDYKDYQYKKSYSSKFEIRINGKDYNYITLNDIVSYKSAVENGSLNNVRKLTIELILDFGRGKNDNMENHENNFEIVFSPYDIKFKRNSNYNDESMDLIENNTKGILDKFPTVNCIFCTKEG